MNAETDTHLKNLQREVAQLREDFAKLGETLKATGRHGRAEANNMARESLANLEMNATRAVEDVAREIEGNPLKSVLTAFGIGVLTGLLVSPRHR